MMELSKEVRQDLRNHAISELPREACGLISVIKGKQRYHPCRNLAPNNVDFVLDPADLVRVEDLVTQHAGEIVAVAHSHPSTSSRPSMVDKIGCEESGLPWVIYSVKFEDYFSFAPSGYRAPLIGRPFKHGAFDCYSAMRDWYFEKRLTNLKDFDREELWWKKGQNLFMENFEIAGFKQVTDGSLLVGDVLLMNIDSEVVNHCAVYIGNDQIFHQTVNRLSSREIYGGFWKKNTRLTLRYQP